MKLKSGTWATALSGRGQVYLGIAQAGEEVIVSITETGWTVDRVSALAERDREAAKAAPARVASVLDAWARPPSTIGTDEDE